MGILGQFQQGDALVHVRIVGPLVAGDIPGIAVAGITPLVQLPIVKVLGHPTVQLVDVHGVQPFLHPVSFELQASKGFLVFAFLVGQTASEALSEPLKDIVVEAELPQQVGEFLFEDEFTHIGLATFPFGAGAVIVDVFPFLDLADHGAATMPAGKQAGECEVMRRSAQF